MTENTARSGKDTILVIGGGIAGITAALEAAEVGCNVILVEKEAYLGGRVVRMNQYFPKLCPPTCGLEINYQRIRKNPRIKVLTLSEVSKVAGQKGNFNVTIRIHPRYVTGNAPISRAQLDAISSEIPNDFNSGMDRTRALYMPHDQAFPHLHVLARYALTSEEISRLEETEPREAIDLSAGAETLDVNVAAIIVATGWQPYDANNLDLLGYSSNADVITNIEMERLAARTGPTGGKIIRPSDGREPARVAFVQCAGSRDANNLPYCSAVCCMASLKQARYLRNKLPDASISIFYIDIRTIGRHEEFYYQLLADDHVSFVKGKVARITPEASNLVLDVEDTLGGKLLQESFDLVVLATGVVPNQARHPLPGLDITTDEYGFIVEGVVRNGIYAAGCACRPTDVSRSVKDATAAALRAIQDVRR